MEHTLITGPDAGPLAVKAAGFVADRIRLAEHDRPWSSVEIDQVEVPGDRSIPAARVQARRSVIFADAPAVDGPPPTFQGAIFDIDASWCSRRWPTRARTWSCGRSARCPARPWARAGWP